MKRYTVIFALIIAAALSGACIERIIPSEEEMLPGINLRFSLGDFPESKAKIDSAGVTSLNENKLNSVEYFIYPDNGTGSDAVMHGYLSNVVANTRVYSVPVTDDIVNTVLCPGSSRYFKVYAIANHPRIIPEAATENLSHTSVAELEALTRDLDTDSQTGNILTTQNSFLMSTNGAFRVGPIEKRATNVVSARIPLERVAAKITILVRLEESVTIPNTVVINGVSDVRNEVWIPRPSQMQVYLVNTAITGQVSGQPVASSPLMQYPTMEFSDTRTEIHSYSTFNPVLDGNGDVTDYTEVTHEGQFTPCEAPFYTNPISWEYGSETEPYIKLMIPWDRQPGVSTGGISYGSASKNYYYRIYCPGDAIDGTHAEFIRNNWYKIVLNVGVLGSDTDGGESIIRGKYYVVDWQERDAASSGSGTEPGVNDSDKEAEIKGARYLFINKDEYEMFNIDELSIPYNTSDPCEIVNVSGTYYDFSGTSKQARSFTPNLELSSVGGAHIKFTHTLNNDTSTSNYDTSEFLITFRLQQKDATDYYKIITIHQYPAIMIDLERNTSTSSPYNAYVNNSSVGNSGGTYYLGSAPGSGSSSNNNYNMVLIQTTVLPSNSSYMLGDPRVMEIDNLNANWPNNNNTGAAATEWSANVTSVQGTTRQLSYYYPVDHTSKANNIIAPKFRIASSRGATQPMTYANAFRRCASYQEFGYPMGRWRLPTVAEVMYIAKLNADDKIERLLGGGDNGTTDYWCNNGYVTVNNTNNDPPEMNYSTPTGTKYVRCVYDDWYWSGMTLNGNDVSQVSKTTPTWGDIAR
ncbi:MAG: hypothetical protein K6E37_01635 [Bacteroidales bacterium]|nr:hypothetical protein [Bacteroidales bacterium]